MKSNNPTVLNLCAGPGGWEEGALLAGLNLDVIGVDVSADAIATARAAGHQRLAADIRTLDPNDWTGIQGLIISPPCPTFSASGLRSGLRDYQSVLDVWTSIGWGIPVDEAMTSVADIEDPRTGLLALAGAWALGVPSLRWLAFEQVPKVEFAWEDLAAELYGAGWEWADVRTLDSADYGVPSRRRRTFLVASRYTPASALGLELGRTSMADALGWGAGHAITTRGARRPTGGNVFSADGPSWCLTGSSRTWEREDGLRLTPAQAGMLVGFDADYPWKGSRTSAFLQAADVVSPPIAAGVLAMVAESSAQAVAVAA
ncbi:DNA cytosine methyltransferase [Agromyces bauzanensis]